MKLLIRGKKGTILDVLLRCLTIGMVCGFSFYFYCLLEQLILYGHFHKTVFVIVLIGVAVFGATYMARKETIIEMPFIAGKSFKWFSHILSFVIWLAIMIPYCHYNFVFYRLFHTTDWFYTLVLITGVSVTVYNQVLFVVRAGKIMMSGNGVECNEPD